ncbi:MAG: methylated-DNA--[protein]-cysteine S-methyltransferase [Verrucomicrobiota bacterium]|nr:methylated-DNA--[protein]-cysteine S-methyltransferase [Verrucomicrobiota bacterium]
MGDYGVLFQTTLKTNRKQFPVTATLPIETADGIFRAHYSNNGLARLDFPNGKIPKINSENISREVRTWHRLTAQALHQVLSGKPAKKFPPLDLSRGTDFQKQVWGALQKIKQTISYTQLAAILNQPKSARAVGGACGKNPIPVLIPCHRVLAANGKLGGFSGGLSWKIKLLERELH